MKRNLALALVAGAVVGAVATIAIASSKTATVTVRNAAAPLSPGSPRHPQGVRLTMALGWHQASTANQPTITKIDVWFPRGALYNGGRYPSCSEQVLAALGPVRCPKGSIMGSGTATAFADTVPTRPRITVVNGGARTVYFFTVLNNPAHVQVPVVGHITRAGGDFTYRLSATIPPNLQVVAGVPIKYTSLQITAGRGTWLSLTSPPAGLKVLTTFSDGTTISAMVWVQNV
jgi:hypothetical protein